MLPEAFSALMLVVDALNRQQIPYLVGGSMASAYHGVARSTIDVDIVADVHPEQVSALVKALGDAFYADEAMILDAIRYRSSFNLIHLGTMFKVDVFIRKERPFDKMQFQRRIERVVANNPEQRVFVTTAEDIILAKLEWFHLGGGISDQQWRDILGVIKVQAGRLDINYLRQWAAELRVSGLLQKALDEAS